MFSAQVLDESEEGVLAGGRGHERVGEEGAAEEGAEAAEAAEARAASVVAAAVKLGERVFVSNGCIFNVITHQV